MKTNTFSNQMTTPLQMAPQGAVCGNDITGLAKDIAGSDFAENLQPKTTCGVDLDADMPPVENDTSGMHVVYSADSAKFFLR